MKASVAAAACGLGAAAVASLREVLGRGAEAGRNLASLLGRVGTAVAEMGRLDDLNILTCRVPSRPSTGSGVGTSFGTHL